jgi:protein TonB
MKKFSILLLLLSVGFLTINAQSNKRNNKAPKSFDAIYRNPQVPAQFPGCQDKEPEYQLGCSQHNLSKYLKEKMKYPKACLKDSLEGISFVSVVIDTMGKLSQFRIDKPAPHPDMDKEALRLVKSMNKMKEKWISAKQGGRKVISQMVIPVKFRIKVPKPAPAILKEDDLDK